MTTAQQSRYMLGRIVALLDSDGRIRAALDVFTGELWLADSEESW